MSLRRPLGGLAALLMLGSGSANADDLTLRPVAVELPTSDRALPAGPGVDLVTNSCTACHSAGMILTQPTLTKAAWVGEVNKMRTTYKASVADDDVEPIASYLAALPVGK